MGNIFAALVHRHHPHDKRLVLETRFSAEGFAFFGRCWSEIVPINSRRAETDSLPGPFHGLYPKLANDHHPIYIVYKPQPFFSDWLTVNRSDDHHAPAGPVDPAVVIQSLGVRKVLTRNYNIGIY
jgi:hypothetical protein